MLVARNCSESCSGGEREGFCNGSICADQLLRRAVPQLGISKPKLEMCAGSGVMWLACTEDPSSPGTGEEQEEKVEYLKALGLEQEDIADIIHRWPQLLRLSLRKNIKPVVKYLESNWIAFKQEQMVTLLNKYPQVRRPFCKCTQLVA